MGMGCIQVSIVLRKMVYSHIYPMVPNIIGQQQEAEPVAVVRFHGAPKPGIEWLVDEVRNGSMLYLHPPAAQPQVPKKTCNWKPEIDGEFWSGECGAAWTLNDAGPKENNMHYCPECGGQLEVSAAKEGK